MEGKKELTERRRKAKIDANKALQLLRDQVLTLIDLGLPEDSYKLEIEIKFKI